MSARSIYFLLSFALLSFLSKHLSSAFSILIPSAPQIDKQHIMTSASSFSKCSLNVSSACRKVQSLYASLASRTSPAQCFNASITSARCFYIVPVFLLFHKLSRLLLLSPFFFPFSRIFQAVFIPIEIIIDNQKERNKNRNNNRIAFNK